MNRTCVEATVLIDRWVSASPPPSYMSPIDTDTSIGIDSIDGWICPSLAFTLRQVIDFSGSSGRLVTVDLRKYRLDSTVLIPNWKTTLLQHWKKSCAKIEINHAVLASTVLTVPCTTCTAPLKPSKNQIAQFDLLSLQVSEILFHPDSAVALLKLRDKAKISERSLPVCLPSPAGGGETTMPVAYTTRWALGAGQRDAPSSQTQLVRVGDVSQCGGESTTREASGRNPLCVTEEQSPLQRASRALVPGFTVAPAAFFTTSAGLSAGGAPEASSEVWQLIGLEGSLLQEGTWQRQARISNFREWIEANVK